MLSRQAILRASRAAAPQRAIASQVRFYAAAAPAAATENVKPPVTLFGVDGTYATALYTAAVKTQSLDPIARSISQLEQLVKKDQKLVTILSSPTLTTSDKTAIVAELEKATGTNNSAVKNLLEVLAENNRLGILPGVCVKFGELLSAARGEIEMTVTSAQPLDSRTLSRLETAISKSSYVGAGKKLKVTNKVTPDIVGGLVVEVGDRTIDFSVSSKLAKMNKLLTDTL